MLGIVAGILVARHLKTTEDLFDTRDGPRTRSMVIAALQWAKRIMGKIDEECEPRNYDAGDKKSHIPGVPKPWGLQSSAFDRGYISGGDYQVSL